MRGGIKAKSKLDRGSDFIIAFPVRVAPELSAVAGGPGETVAGAESLAGKSYLLLDDIPENTFILSQILKRHKMMATESNNGVLALETYKSNPSHFDGVITDLRMPMMSGQSFITEVRKFERETKIAHAVPILVMTAENSGEEKRLCLTQYGANDFLLKPVKLRDLIESLIKLHNRDREKSRQRKKRVLIVDDDVISSKFTATVLERDGHVCVNAFSVDEGLKELDREGNRNGCEPEYDVVILDNLLGDGTGMDFLRSAQKLFGEKLWTLPKVISISGNNVEDQRKLYEVDMCRIEGYLQKPARKQDLLAMIQIA